MDGDHAVQVPMTKSLAYRLVHPTPARILNHILETPALVSAVRELPGPALAKLIDSVGLEDASELVALASTAQLETVFDEDLWQSGGDNAWQEQFDPARFALWLHAFVEAGEDALVRRLVELPLDLVTLAVQRLILVLDIESLAIEMSSSGQDLDHLEKALDSCAYEEWEEFRLIARNDAAWDDVCQALLALDRDHHQLLRQILEQCAAMSGEWIDDNGGLYSVLTSEEMMESDVKAERDDRRARKGFVSAADARAFLLLARASSGETGVRDPISKAYFRELEPTRSKPLPARATRPRQAGGVARLQKLLLGTHGMDPTAAVPDTSLAPNRSSVRLLDRCLAQLRSSDPELYDARMGELTYLANVLIAAPKRRGRQLRPVEAIEVAVTIVDRGLTEAVGEQRAGSSQTVERGVDRLRTTSADQLFRDAFPQLDLEGVGSNPTLSKLQMVSLLTTDTHASQRGSRR